MAGKYDTQQAIHLIMQKGRVQTSREDVTAFCLAKLAQIVLDADNAPKEVIEEIISDGDASRIYGLCMGMMGLLVQYAERSGGFLALCTYLTSRVPEEGMAGLSETKW